MDGPQANHRTAGAGEPAGAARELPYLVFTANAGLVMDGAVVPSCFRSKERQGEEPIDRRWFEET